MFYNVTQKICNNYIFSSHKVPSGEHLRPEMNKIVKFEALFLSKKLLTGKNHCKTNRYTPRFTQNLKFCKEHIFEQRNTLHNIPGYAYVQQISSKSLDPFSRKYLYAIITFFIILDRYNLTLRECYITHFISIKISLR